jgi:3-hydroxymyristoyl/3-hydroxydecanoyl-(acyl carrier protein) dehydratase
MSLPPVHVVDVSDEQATLDIEVPAELEAFRGHFSGHPILPGVVQIDWAVRLAVLHLGIGKPVARDFQVKFRNVIRPGNAISLTLQLDRSKNRLLFAYKSKTVVMSDGQIKLGAKT